MRYNSIAVISTDYPAINHPVYVFVEQLTHAFVDMGGNVSVVAPQSITRHLFRGVPLMPKVSEGKTSMGHTYKIYRPYYISLGNCSGILAELVSFIRKRSIRRVLKLLNVDILYGHFWDNVLPVLDYAREKKIPLFAVCGEGDDALEELDARLTKARRQQIRETVNGVISVSSENKRKCIDYGLTDEAHVQVFPNCVNTDIFKPQDVSRLKKELGIGPEDFTVAFVGGFIHRKGAKRLSDAISSLNDPHIKSIFIGKPFAGDCAEPDCAGIVFKGALNHEDIPSYLNCADIFVLPTLKEGCCNAIVEALSTGLPVISSNGAFNDDIIDENNSIRVDPMDIAQIAAAIKKMKDDKLFFQRLKQNIACNHHQYSINGRARRILDFIVKHV